MGLMRVFAAVVRRDMKLAWSQGGAGGLSIGFFVIAISLFPFGIGADKDLLARIAPGTVWVVAMLAGLISLDRLYQADFEDGSLDGLLLSPLPVELLVLAKTLAHWLAIILPLALMAPLAALLLNMTADGLLWLAVSFLVGTPTLSLLGSVGASLTVAIRRGGVLLALLILPLYVPTLIFGTGVVLAAESGADPTPALALLGAVSLISLIVSPLASAAALRMAAE